MNASSGAAAAGGVFGVVLALRCCWQQAEQRRHRRAQAVGERGVAAPAAGDPGRAASPSPCSEPAADRRRSAGAGRLRQRRRPRPRSSSSSLGWGALGSSASPRGSDSGAAPTGSPRTGSPAVSVHSGSGAGAGFELRELEGVVELRERLRLSEEARDELEEAEEQLRLEVAQQKEVVRYLELALEQTRREGYDAVREVGAGAFGVTELISRRSDGLLFARKTAQASAEWPLHLVLNEATVLSQISHPNCLELFTANMDKAAGRLVLVTEYAEGGDLEAWWQREGTVSGGLRIYRDVCCALGHLHERFIIHHDVKPDNILVRGDGSGLLGDFGLAMATQGHAVTVTAGTERYMAPEVFAQQPHTGAADVWSIGCVLHQICGDWEHPHNQQSSKVRLSPRVVLPMRSWVMWALADVPTQRPSAEALVEWYDTAERNGHLYP
eukprot:TRINITY_DN12505_c0_g2_i1.p1 TRINITY_DN12505_c0_g2~~TRINITY_DN12505_c0_g2_i1.p1  ORF type:complete len:440 (+),score=108.00 TRINITY_DN12505_c0_g2_i1:78-1397(+)